MINRDILGVFLLTKNLSCFVGIVYCNVYCTLQTEFYLNFSLSYMAHTTLQHVPLLTLHPQHFLLETMDLIVYNILLYIALLHLHILHFLYDQLRCTLTSSTGWCISKCDYCGKVFWHITFYIEKTSVNKKMFYVVVIPNSMKLNKYKKLNCW